MSDTTDQRWHRRHFPGRDIGGPDIDRDRVSCRALSPSSKDFDSAWPSQPVIEQSKGMLMLHYGIGPDAAFDVLRRSSIHANRKLRDISEMIVAATTAEHRARRWSIQARSSSS